MRIHLEGPHLLVGGSHDGERVECDASKFEIIHKHRMDPPFRHLSPPPLDGELSVIGGTVTHENYFRHMLQANGHFYFIYALDMTDVEVMERLINHYGGKHQ